MKSTETTTQLVLVTTARAAIWILALIGAITVGTEVLGPAQAQNLTSAIGAPVTQCNRD